jgi:serine/threonine-protein kinase
MGLLGMALLRGLVTPGALQDAVRSSREAGPTPLDRLLAAGILDDTDLEVLGRLLDERGPSSVSEPARSSSAAEGTAGEATAPAWDAGRRSPVSENTALWIPPPREDAAAGARQVLENLHVPAWKHYRNLRFLGEGGMGRIFKAFDPTLKRRVALKFLKRSDPKLVLRFVLEAQNQAMVDHPNVCKVFEVGEWQGQSYIAMQFIRGETLETLGPSLSPDEGVGIMETVAEAVHAAHRKGLTHRDLKPANIMVERNEDRSCKPYVLDFGLAQDINSTGLTVQGVILGTVHYMAPEQARGDRDRIDRRTDVYALGATLYRLVTGRVPFFGADGLECLRQTVEEDAVPVRRLAPQVPADLETIIHKCLEKEPERRYATARALAEDLRRFREGDPILAHAPTLGYRISKQARKHKLLVALGSASLGVMAALGGWGLSVRMNATARARWAQHFGQQAEQVEALVRYAHLLPAHDLTAEHRQLEARLQVLEADAQRAGSLAEGPGAYALGRAFLALGDSGRAKTLLEKAWRSGFQAPAVSAAYGRVLGRIYQAELDRTRGIENPELRDRRLAELKRSLRDPALWHLRAGEAMSLEPREYQESLLALFEGRHEEALAKARSASLEMPWFYESRRLEGDIRLAMARKETDPVRAESLLQGVATAYRAAEAIAPSDPDLYLGEARAWQDQMAQDWQTGKDPTADLAACDRACDLAMRLQPTRAEALGLRAWALAALGRHRMERGGDCLPPLRQAAELADEALTRDPSCQEALRATVFAQGALGNELWRRGEDPRAAFHRAVDAAESLLAQAPWDANTALYAAKACAWSGLYAGYRGLPGLADFDRGLAIARRLSAAQPDLAAGHGALGMLCANRMDLELLCGQDPGPSAEEAEAALGKALALAPSDFSHWINLGDARAFLATHRLLTGGDPRPVLEGALGASQKASSVNPGHYLGYLNQGIARTLEARDLLKRGGDPGPALRAALEGIRRSQTLAPREWQCQLRLGQLALVDAEARARREEDPEPAFQEAEKALRASLAMGPENPNLAYDALAELCAARAERRKAAGQEGQDPIQAGLAFAQRALAVNPRDAEAFRQQGRLQVLGAAGARDPRRRALLARQGLEALEQATSINGHLARLCSKPLAEARNYLSSVRGNAGDSTSVSPGTRSGASRPPGDPTVR